MHAHDPSPSSTEIATGLSGPLVGLGILTTTLFPLALPGLVLALPLLVPLVPLALGALALLLLSRLLVLPIRLVRFLVRSGS